MSTIKELDDRLKSYCEHSGIELANNNKQIIRELEIYRTALVHIHQVFQALLESTLEVYDKQIKELTETI